MLSPPPPKPRVSCFVCLVFWPLRKHIQHLASVSCSLSSSRFHLSLFHILHVEVVWELRLGPTLVAKFHLNTANVIVLHLPQLLLQLLLLLLLLLAMIWLLQPPFAAHPTQSLFGFAVTELLLLLLPRSCSPVCRPCSVTPPTFLPQSTCCCCTCLV